MRKILLALFILVIVCVAGALGFVWYTFHEIAEHDISVRVNDSEDSYTLSASFNRHQSRRIHRLLQNELQNDLFRKDKVDADLTLDDDTRIHVKTTPGKLVIACNKRQNNATSYLRIRKLGEDVAFSLSH